MSVCLPGCLPAVYLSFCLPPSVCLSSVCLSVCPSVCLSVCPLSACLSVCPLSACLFVCLPSVCLSACLFVCLPSVCLSSVCLPAYPLSVCLPACLSVCLSVCLPSVCLSVCLSICLPTCLHSFSNVMYYVQQGFDCYFIIVLPSTGESNSSDELCFSHVCFVENEVRILLFLIRKISSVVFNVSVIFNRSNKTIVSLFV